jgi:hypothetical protein
LWGIEGRSNPPVYVERSRDISLPIVSPLHSRCRQKCVIFKPHDPFKKSQKTQEVDTESVYARALPERRK